MSNDSASSSAAIAERRSLRGEHVLIVGGTSGIGLAVARLAQAEGAHVTVSGFHAVQAEEIARTHGFAKALAFDITDANALTAALAPVASVDHLVLLAGTFVAGRVREAGVDHLRRAFDERVWGAVHAIRALGDRLSVDGSVTLISGVLADRPTGTGTAVLAAASAAMEALARGLALEIAPTRVNVLSPGTLDTPLLARTLGENREAYLASLKASLPVHRVGVAEDAAEAVRLLMLNPYMTGETLHVDGGQRLV